MRQPIFYSVEDVECAGIIEDNPHLFEFSFQVWAAKVIAWFRNFLALIDSKVTRLRGRGITTPIQKIITDITNSIKSGKIFINPIMLTI